MFSVAKDDILRGLKRFKRLAKQDLLSSSLTSNPEFWSRQAEARRETYDLLMKVVDRDGVESAYEAALRQYVDLPRFSAEFETDPKQRGIEQALEMFFTILGISSQAVQEARNLQPQLENVRSDAYQAMNTN